MAFFALLWKSRTIEKYRLEYEKEKINSIVMGNTQMEQTLSQRWRHYRYDTQKRISRTFRKWYPEGSSVANFFLYLITDQTFPNFLLKSLMGFVSGIILTYLCFMFFVFQLAISLIHATIMSSIIGVLLTLGLAFSYRIRCLVFLLIPQLFSRVGRYTLTCYALVLILTGPATNTLKNSEVLSESMACTQEQIKISVHQLDDLAKKPYDSIKYSLVLMVEKFKEITAQVKQMLIALNRLLLSIVGFIQYSFSWLQSMSNACNKKLGTPYKRCTDLMRDGIEDCRRMLGPEIYVLCNMAYLSKAVCYAVKPFSAYCYVTDFMDEAILASIRKKLKNFTAKVRALFYVEIHIHQSYSFSNNSSRTASQVAAGIVTEIRNRTGPLLTWLSWSSCVTSLFLLLIIFRAKYYQHMYETRSRFDNRYVTKELRELDLKRQRQGRETVLPLNRRERAKYITTTSFRLVTSEKVYLTRSAVYMAITTFKLLIHMVADYSLYWVLMTIRHHGKKQSTDIPGVSHTGAHVTDNSYGARLFRSIVDGFNLPLSQPTPSLIPCLPDPYLPDFKRYTQIGVLIFLMWFFALFEPYGLRMRHLIMAQYRPERARARASWLYNHILRTRAGFMKFARRKLHREYKYSTESVHTFSHWLDDHIPFQCLKYMLGIGPQEPHCLLCGITNYPNDTDTKLIRCETPKCPGVFCTNCFSDIGQLCTICLSPADYGDLSDASLEKGSSDDSDSGPEFEGTIDATDKTRLVKNIQNNETPKSKSTSRKWHIFRKSPRTHAHDTFDVVQRTNNKDLHFIQYPQQRQLQSVDRMTNTSQESMSYNISLDYNNNMIVNVFNMKQDVVCKTKSIGIGTNERRSVLNKILVKLLDIFLYKKQPKPLNSFKKQTVLTKLNRTKLTKTWYNKIKCKQDLNKFTGIHNFVIVQYNFKRPDRRKAFNNTFNTYRLGKGFNNAIRFFYHNNKRMDSDKNKKGNTNKIQNTSKGNKLKPLDNSTPKENTDKTVTEDKNKPKKRNSKEKAKNVRIKESRHQLLKFHTFFANHWRTLKSNVCRPKTKNQSEKSGLSEKKNHKRRKKRKDNINVTVNTNVKKAKKDIKWARNYRISAFLADHDWTKREYRDAVRIDKNTDDTCHVVMPVCDSRTVAPNRNKLVAMVQLTSKPFQWQDIPLEEYRAYPDKIISCTDSSFRYGVYRQNALKALQRFRHKVNSMMPSPPSSLIQKMLSTVNMARKPSPYLDSSICLSKRASFYRSFRKELLKRNSGAVQTDVLFRNEDFNDNVIPLESNPALRNLTTKKNNLTRSTSNTKEIKKRSLCLTNSSEKAIMKTTTVERCKCDSALDMKTTPKMPLRKRMKRFCSSLFTHSSCKSSKKVTCENALEREKQMDEKRLCAPEQPPKKRKTKKMSAKELKSALNPKITPCREKCLPPEEFLKDDETMAQNLVEADARAKCKEIEMAKIKEIQRHIEKEREIEQEILMEHERHKEKEREIEREFGMELARHREKEKRLMCDGDTQTLLGDPVTIPLEIPIHVPILCKKKEVAITAVPTTKSCVCETTNNISNKNSSLKSKLKKDKKMKKNKQDKANVVVPVACECDSKGAKSSPDDISKNAEVTAVPDMHSGICETVRQFYCNAATQDSSFKLAKAYKAKKEKFGPKVTCTCATQYWPVEKPSGTNQPGTIYPTKPPPNNYSPVCIAPSPFNNIPFMRSGSSSTGVSNGSTSPNVRRSAICLNPSPVTSKHTINDGKPNRYKDTSILAKLSPITTKDKSLTPRTCRVKDIATVTVESQPSLKHWIGDSPNYKWSPVLSKHSIDQKSRSRKETSVLAKILPRSPSPRVKHLSTITTLSPIEFTKMTDKQCSPARENRSTLNIFKNLPSKYQSSEVKQKKYKRERGERHSSHRQPIPKGTHYNYHWKRNSAPRDNDVKYDSARRRKLSLESSLYDDDTPSVFNDVQTTTSDTISVSSHSSYYFSDAGTKTDTTFCSLATVNYDERSRRRNRVRVVTKANQSTSTEKARLCDRGTTTYDWWSPMFEKKKPAYLEKSKGRSIISKQRKEIVDFNENRKINNRALTADGKIVKFKSRTQIIPAGLFRFKNDIMSPSRYLLESQKYYNELFAYNMRPSRVIECAHFNDKPRTSIGSRRNHRRAKRLDDSYSPRRQYSPRKRYTDSARTSDSPRKRYCHYRKHDHRQPKIYYAVQ